MTQDGAFHRRNVASSNRVSFFARIPKYAVNATAATPFDDEQREREDRMGEGLEHMDCDGGWTMVGSGWTILAPSTDDFGTDFWLKPSDVN